LLAVSSDAVHVLPADGLASGRGASAPVAILLCTFNGARFLPQQLASYEAQDFADWRLFVSDDDSQDATLPLLEAFQKKHCAERVQIRRGPCRGFAANFLSLICDRSITSAYCALSDQDDVWAADKLSRALAALSAAPVDVPVVYCSRTRLIDEDGADIRLSFAYTKPPHFRNALAQSLASGNTMVLNEPARQLLMRAGADVNIPAHDWWIYLATTAAGGRMLYDSAATVGYRMHSGNIIGSNRAAGAQMRRAGMLWQGHYKTWTDMHVAALARLEGAMTEENRRTFEQFRRARERSALPRAYGLIRAGVYRQSFLGNVGLLAAALAGKV
jgi:glycosyltransferase involved in cell wall biosynthesis